MKTNDERRWELIFKELFGVLGKEESAELDRLQAEAKQKTNLNSYKNKVKPLDSDDDR